MTTLWYSTAEHPEEYTDHVTLEDTVTDDDIDDVIYRIMRDVKTDHIHYVIQKEGSENRYVSVSICRP
jgi:transcription antitermination factor NusA-like protein